MRATQIPVCPAVAERTRRILSACQSSHTADAYARSLVEALASGMHSEFAIWLNWPAGHGEPVAYTAGCEIVLPHLRALCNRAPILSNDLDVRFVRSIAAVPMMFRHSPAGVLAVANAANPYTPADLDVLAEIGRAALADYESRERADALGIRAARESVPDFVHDLRQPLGILEVCTYYLDIVLPDNESKARQQLVEMRRQIDCASRILDQQSEAYIRRRFDETAAEPETEPSRVFTNSAMSMVT
jgi:hypothetical protein